MNTIVLSDGGSVDLNDASSGILIAGNATSSGITVTLNLISGLAAGWQATIVQIGTGAGITISCNSLGGQSINGGASVTLSTQYNAVTLLCIDGSAFVAIGI